MEALHIDRDPGRFPVFQTAFSYSEPPQDIEAAGVTFRCERIPLRASKYDLGFLAEPRPDGLRLEATYTPALFDAVTVRRLLGNFEVLLRGVADDPSARLGRLPVLTEAELRAELRVGTTPSRTCRSSAFMRVSRSGRRRPRTRWRPSSTTSGSPMRS